MIILTSTQLARFKNTKICFDYADPGKSWIDEGIIEVPRSNVFAEDYASYFSPTPFYSNGAFSYSWSPFPEFVSVGRYCSIAIGVKIMLSAHPTDLFTTSAMVYDSRLLHRRNFYEDFGYDSSDIVSHDHPTNQKDIFIGNDVYIAAHVTLRRGIKIADGAIIGAHAVVTKDVPPYSVVVGNPGKVVRKRFSDEQIVRLLADPWWNYDFKDVLNRTHVSNIDMFLNRLNHLISTGEIRKFEPKRHYFADLLA
jgi:acetyltransferase-like isoleucine patch superfamily enzyme